LKYLVDNVTRDYNHTYTMKKSINLIAVIFLIFCQSCTDGTIHSSKQIIGRKMRKIAFLDTITVRSYIHHISDLDFKNQHYKIELWLYLTSKYPLSDSLANQIEIKDATESKIAFIPDWKENKKIRDSSFRGGLLIKGSCYRRILKIKCTMIQKWDVDGYPFDDQQLVVTLYTIRPLPWLYLDPVVNKINYNDVKDSVWDIENGWQCRQDSAKVHPVLITDIFDDTKQYSALKYTIPMFREGTGGLFFKLFVGMYVAFLVAFIAMFIPIHKVEPRFGLPVGGLFAVTFNSRNFYFGDRCILGGAAFFKREEKAAGSGWRYICHR